MKRAMALVIAEAFGPHQLHRLEANIQPGNIASIALVASLGFRHEGYAERYIKVAGQWRDHDRYALMAEKWGKGGIEDYAGRPILTPQSA